MSAILTESLETDDGVIILCPPAIILAFLLKFSPIFMSNMTWQSTYWNPGGIYILFPSNISNAMWTLFISWRIVDHHKVSLLILSSFIASSTLLGIIIPNLCVRVQYLASTLAIVLVLFLITKGIHHAKAGSSAIYFWIAKSARSTGYDWLMSVIASYVELPSFHCNILSHPFVVSLRRRPPFLDIIIDSCCFSSVLLVL